MSVSVVSHGSLGTVSVMASSLGFAETSASDSPTATGDTSPTVRADAVATSYGSESSKMTDASFACTGLCRLGSGRRPLLQPCFATEAEVGSGWHWPGEASVTSRPGPSTASR